MWYEEENNLRYFASSSMLNLCQEINEWQNRTNKSFQSINIQKDGDKFCCIALISPIKVMITD
jgi:hypothetical protein